MGFKLKAALAALAAGLTGCVIGGRTIYHVDDPFQFLAHAASRGVVPVMVVGQPYPNRQAQVEVAVVEAFDRNFKSLGNPFRAAEPQPGTSTKIVVLFNVGDSVLSRDICADPTRILPVPTRTRTSARAIYCGDGPYSEYSMSFPTPQSPEDPKFGEMMNKLAYFTVPREPNPERR